jgi:hypothetical protein
MMRRDTAEGNSKDEDSLGDSKIIGRKLLFTGRYIRSKTNKVKHSFWVYPIDHRRLAVNPPNSMLNYLYVLLESKARLVLSALC